MSDPYMIEFITQGRYVKVTAIDPATGREATIVGDPRESQATLSRHAVKKLEFLLSKK